MDISKNFWSKGIGYGVMIWILLYFIVLILSFFNIFLGGWMGIAIAIFAGLLSYLFARSIGLLDYKSAIIYGLIWAAVGFLLDAVLTRITAPQIYSLWTYWLAYLLIIFAPLIAVWQPKKTNA